MNGFVYKRTKGSHKRFYNPQTKKWTGIPQHNRELSLNQIHYILKQAGLE